MTPSSSTSPNFPRIALTSGEPAGVGPELCLALAARALPCELVCLADFGLLEERSRALGGAVTLRRWEGASGAARPHVAGSLDVEHHPLVVRSIAGRLDTANVPYVLSMLNRAIDGTLAGEFAAIVTAPVHKGVINDAGVHFSGHTEHLAQRTRAACPVMLLTNGALRVALATTHLPLKAVSAAITQDLLFETAVILQRDLRRWWGIGAPRIAVCGLNPHAGESGHLGDEELKTIAPAIARMRAGGIDAHGPLPADTVFIPRILADFDAVLAMYHDQGLPVVKHAGFEQAVNVTLGLPILRTSPDHGTALDLAGRGVADVGSLAAAVQLAIRLATHRR
jgi:4-hydroxythreonine-4-phosphate dehydrogenase